MKLRTWLIGFPMLSTASATIINVPGNQSTIQAGIDAATAGDTVLVDTGTYVENINFNGKNIVVGSLFLTTGDTANISQTVIDGNQSGSVVTFDNGEDSTAVLSGFTITNGFASLSFGGGIYCYHSSPSLVNVTVSGNAAYIGGGICCDISNLSLENVTITRNTASACGGIACFDLRPSLVDVTISGNTGGLWGGGIYCSGSSPSLVNVTISGNTVSESGGGIYCKAYSNPSLANVTITGNTASAGGGIFCGYGSSLSFDSENRCNIYLNHSSLGNDLYAYEVPTIAVVVDTFTVMNPTDYHAYPLDNFTFDILNAKIEQVDIQITGDLVPMTFALHPSYPNPFNPVTTFRYDLPQQAEVVLTIYDLMGRELRTLVQGEQGPGYNSVVWDGTDDRGQPVSSGVYLYRIQAGGFTQTRKMVLLR